EPRHQGGRHRPRSPRHPGGDRCPRGRRRRPDHRHRPRRRPRAAARHRPRPGRRRARRARGGRRRPVAPAAPRRGRPAPGDPRPVPGGGRRRGARRAAPRRRGLPAQARLARRAAPPGAGARRGRDRAVARHDDADGAEAPRGTRVGSRPAARPVAAVHPRVGGPGPPLRRRLDQADRQGARPHRRDGPLARQAGPAQARLPLARRGRRARAGADGAPPGQAPALGRAAHLLRLASM
ncbi:MAG: hypothetical protein AVDCRST_MAG13-3049, partial [uncultured Solirubrobacteraceae bacterium]